VKLQDPEFCIASPTKAGRRTKAEIDGIKGFLYRIVEKHRPMTIRQVFYQAVSAGVINKTEAEYNATIIRLLADMRLSGSIPFHWIADNTRWMRKPDTYGSIQEAIRETAKFYRQAIWRDLDVYAEFRSASHSAARFGSSVSWGNIWWTESGGGTRVTTPNNWTSEDAQSLSSHDASVSEKGGIGCFRWKRRANWLSLPARPLNVHEAIQPEDMGNYPAHSS
jgi:hypothetical protein